MPASLFLGSQHCMADWHRQVAAIMPAKARDEGNQSWRAKIENQTSCVPTDLHLAANILLAPVEKVSAQAKAVTAELVVLECGLPHRCPDGPEPADGVGPSRSFRPKLRLLPCLPRPGPNE